MVVIQKATEEHVDGIVEVCVAAQWATYGELYTKEYIVRTIDEYYTPERIKNEIVPTNIGWGGWFVALDNGEVVGAGGGGMQTFVTAEVYALYLSPLRRNEGIGTKLLAAITEQQRKLGATEQWISVAKGNEKGIPFYNKRGFIFQEEVDSYHNKEGEVYISLRYSRPI